MQEKGVREVTVFYSLSRENKLNHHLYPQAVQLKFKLHDVMVKTKECSDASGEVSTLAADPF